MRNILLLVIGLTGSLVASGQIEKGKSFITGSFGISESFDNNTFLTQFNYPSNLKITTLDGTVSYNYLISNRFSIGPSLGWSIMWGSFNELISVNPYTYSGDFKGTNRAIDIGVTFRYFQPVRKDLFLTFSATGAKYYAKQEFKNSGETEFLEFRGSSVTVVPSLAYALNERWIAYLTFGEIFYVNRYPKNVSEFNVSDFRAKFDLASLKLGVIIRLGKTSKSDELEVSDTVVPMFDNQN